MYTIAKASEIDRIALFRNTAEKMNLHEAIIEKDFWVCLTLDYLFRMSKWKNTLVFKGGTSLAKAFRLIRRFSEDIDIVIDRGYLGFGGKASPEKASSRKQQRRRLEDLRTVCQKAIQERIQPALADRIVAIRSRSSGEGLIPDPEDPDGQTLLFQYPSVLPAYSYIRPTPPSK
jgi:hypothetical protein